MWRDEMMHIRLSIEAEERAGKSAPATGGPEVWNVVTQGPARECHDIATTVDEVRKALQRGCRTISIERQGSPDS